MVVHAPRIARKAKAGQFVIVRPDERGERIPLTLVDWDREAGTITLVFLEVGVSTKKLGMLEVGEAIPDLIGPLGKPAEVSRYGTAVVVGGGVGVAAAYPRARAIKEAGNYVVSIIGARTAELIVYEEQMRSVSDEVHVSTDDGSRGFKGFTSQLLESLLKGGLKADYVYAVGPAPMMKAVCDVTRRYGIKTVVSLNSIMVDGTGMCGACRVTVGGRTVFTCVDGPEFDGHQVDFEELIRRLSMYRDEERLALERFERLMGRGCGQA